jgi:thiamine transport system substrate-binding protein
MNVLRHRLTALTIVAATVPLATAACGSSDVDGPGSITLVAYDSFPEGDTALNDALASFTDETGIEVDLLIAGDTGTMLSKASLTAGNPEGDVMWGVDNTFLSRAIDDGVFEPYETNTDHIPAHLTALAPGGEATPVDFGDVCVNYDIGALAALGVDPPESLEDLLDPLYADMLVVEDPATSSPGLAFLMATIAAYPDGAEYDWKAFWTGLFTNGAVVATDWSEAYYTRFTRSGGVQPLVVSYASSPPAEVFFGELAEAPTGVMADGCFRQVEYAGILHGTDHASAAGKLIDFLLSVPTQEDIPLNMFMYPANDLAVLPQVIADHTTFPEHSLVLEPGTINENRERWIREWTEIARS